MRNRPRVWVAGSGALLLALALGLSFAFFSGSSERGGGSVEAAAASDGAVGPLGGDVTVNVGSPTNRFSPGSVNIQPGDTVTWDNVSGADHNVTAISGSFPNSGNMDPGDEYQFTFNTPGTYYYYCTIHASSYNPDTGFNPSGAMHGRVIVGDGGPTNTPTNTPTPTNTRTPTATPTNTSIVPATNTPTPTNTPTATGTEVSETSTPTPTETQVEFTPSATATATTELTPTATTTTEPPIMFFEGWNELEVWMGAQLEGEQIDVCFTAGTTPGWAALAYFDPDAQLWLQRFVDPPLPAFNTYTVIAPDSSFWVYVTENATFEYVEACVDPDD